MNRIREVFPKSPWQNQVGEVVWRDINVINLCYHVTSFWTVNAVSSRCTFVLKSDSFLAQHSGAKRDWGLTILSHMSSWLINCYLPKWNSIRGWHSGSHCIPGCKILHLETQILCQMMSLVTSWFYLKLMIQSAIRWALLAIIFERSRWDSVVSRNFESLSFSLLTSFPTAPAPQESVPAPF